MCYRPSLTGTGSTSGKALYLTCGQAVFLHVFSLTLLFRLSTIPAFDLRWPSLFFLPLFLFLFVVIWARHYAGQPANGTKTTGSERNNSRRRLQLVAVDTGASCEFVSSLLYGVDNFYLMTYISFTFFFSLL